MKSKANMFKVKNFDLKLLKKNIKRHKITLKKTKKNALNTLYKREI